MAAPALPVGYARVPAEVLHALAQVTPPRQPLLLSVQRGALLVAVLDGCAAATDLHVHPALLAAAQLAPAQLVAVQHVAASSLPQARRVAAQVAAGRAGWAQAAAAAELLEATLVQQLRLVRLGLQVPLPLPEQEAVLQLRITAVETEPGAVVQSDWALLTSTTELELAPEESVEVEEAGVEMEVRLLVRAVAAADPASHAVLANLGPWLLLDKPKEAQLGVSAAVAALTAAEKPPPAKGQDAAAAAPPPPPQPVALLTDSSLPLHHALVPSHLLQCLHTPSGAPALLNFRLAAEEARALRRAATLPDSWQAAANASTLWQPPPAPPVAVAAYGPQATQLLEWIYAAVWPSPVALALQAPTTLGVLVSGLRGTGKSHLVRQVLRVLERYTAAPVVTVRLDAKVLLGKC